MLAEGSDVASPRLSCPCLVVGQPFQAVVLISWKAGPTGVFRFSICATCSASARLHLPRVRGRPAPLRRRERVITERALKARDPFSLSAALSPLPAAPALMAD